VCTCVLARQTIELVCLHHRDQASAQLEDSIVRVDTGPNGHIGDSGGGVVAEGLGHCGSSRWCGMTSSVPSSDSSIAWAFAWFFCAFLLYAFLDCAFCYVFHLYSNVCPAKHVSSNTSRTISKVNAYVSKSLFISPVLDSN